MPTSETKTLEGLSRRVKIETAELPVDQITQEDYDVFEAPLPPLSQPDTHRFGPSYSGEMPDPLALYGGPKVKLYTKNSLELFFEKMKISAGERHELAELKDLLELLWNRGEDRKLASVPRQHRDGIAHLKAKFLNFNSVIDFISGSLEVSLLKDGAVRMTPILLSGPPGIGKTVFAEALATWINSGFQIIRYDSAQSGSETSGSSSFWSNAQPGKVFECLTQGGKGYANPVFFLDELDKAPQNASYDPLGPLHGLLDDSARHFEDLCFPLRIDASHIIYIAACNDVQRIPAPLRSRFRHFEIDITPGQGKSIAYRIAHELVLELGLLRPNFEIDLVCFDMLAKHSPRKIRQILLEAIGRALSQDRKRVEVSDLVLHESSKPRVGFM